MKNNSPRKFSKLFVIDISPGNDYITKELLMGRLARAIKNASLYEHVVLIGHSSFYILKKIIEDANLKSGFIVSDSGARIYDIKADKFIFESPLLLTNLKAAIHNALMLNLLVLASSNTREYAYSLDIMNTLCLDKQHYLPLQTTDDFEKFSKFAYSNRVFSLMCYFKNPTMLMNKLRIFQAVAND